MAHVNKEKFKNECNKISNKLLGFDAFDGDDSYDLLEVLDDYIEKKVDIDPRSFILEMFHEDIASIEYDEYLRKESLKYYE